MVREGIVLGHQVSSKGIKVDLAKIFTIEKLPLAANVKGIHRYLGHAGFYQRFIKDFSKIIKPLCNLLEKDAVFVFDDNCCKAFELIKEKLIFAPFIILPNWSDSFEIMCDVRDYTVSVVLGQRREKMFTLIYYASQTLNDA